MSKSKLRGKDLIKIGYTEGRVIGITVNVMAKHFKKMSRQNKMQLLTEILENPQAFLETQYVDVIAKELVTAAEKVKEMEVINLNKQALDYRIYGKQHIGQNAIDQMDVAMKLPVAVGGALMPDAHQGYGLPIGGVLATENAVIPYGVGVDIGCRMCLTMYNMKPSYIKGHHAALKKMLMANTAFGAGQGVADPMDDPIFENEAFQEIGFVRGLKDTAFKQIGSSGGGNHFVEFGVVSVLDPDNEWDIPVGDYIAILSHSGSRGLGARIANHYTKIAMEKCKLPKEAKHLAWLDLNTEAGMEYWIAMNLAGDYASACHHHIHRRLSKALGEKPMAMVENHHNFAWKELLEDGTEVIVHRKGATPAGKGVLGIIPGSMTAPGFIVRGKGDFTSLNSASHGAGRQFSRRKAKENFTKKQVRDLLKKSEVTLIGGGIDEAPMAYKDINQVIASQSDLVEVIGKFQPRIVRMAAD